MKISVVFRAAAALIFVIPFFIDSGLLVILIALASLLFGLKYFMADRRDLKSAIYYIRMNEKAEPSVWRSFISLIILLTGLIIVFSVFEDFFEGFIDLFKWPTLSGFYVLPLGAMYLTVYYYKFKNSLRSYTTGIKLPGRDQEIIDWKSVEELSFVDTTITVKAEQNENKYRIKAEDKDDLDRIIAMWKNETDKENQL